MESQSASFEEAQRHRATIHHRLEEEGEQELADLIGKCGEPLLLICTTCGFHHPIETKCKQKWCPVCVRGIATRRSLKYRKAASMMHWPLFLTLTVRNLDNTDAQFVRKLRRDFGKLRHRKIWKNNVKGGVAAIEVTNKGKGWHPHLHALIDCRWLAIKTPRPQQNESRDNIRKKCTAAKREFTKLWSTIIGEQHGVCWIQRTTGEQCAREVLKYAIKGSQLAESRDPIGPIIHQLRATRLTTSFGNCFGKLLVRDDEQKRVVVCPQCKDTSSFAPDFVIEKLLRRKAA